MTSATLGLPVVWRFIWRPLLLLFLISVPPALAADSVSTPPPSWQDELSPVADADVSGAEPLMQQAIAAARAETNALLASAAPDRDALAAAYGRLGALFLLVEVEAQADACLRNAMALQPAEFRWPYYAGYLAMLAGNLDRALEYLETARAIDPDYPTLYVRLGKVRLDRSDLAEARAALERVKDSPELASPANYYLGQIAVLERRFADAVPLLEAALAANPDATEVHYPLAQAHRALGNAEQARAHLAQFKLRAPEIADPLLAELQAATKRSLPAFKRAIHAVREGEYSTAVNEFDAGLAVDPDNAAARISYARVLYLVGRREDAAVELSRALEIAPDQVLGHFLVGALREQRGDLDGAASAYRHALTLDPAHVGALFQLANLDFDAGRYAEAAEGYRRVLAADASVAPARVLALIAARRAGTPEAEIIARLQRAVEQHRDDLQLRYAQARLLAAADDAALRDGERAVALAVDLLVQQPIPPHQRLLALAQAAAGRWGEAAETQQRLLAMAGWMAPPQAIETMQNELTAYQAKELPQPAWPEDDPLLAPPPFDAARPFRDYPATLPY
jgi:tetratricopeptide (TPR) repeat protein